LSGLARLTSLDLGHSRVTDAGLKHLVGLPNLVRLDLRGTRTGDAGLESLLAVTSLKYLNLDETDVTDGGVEHLMKMTWLETLVIPSLVGPECLKVLKDFLPDTTIVVEVPSPLDERPQPSGPERRDPRRRDGQVDE
jgi:hypothetical protein